MKYFLGKLVTASLLVFLAVSGFSTTAEALTWTPPQTFSFLTFPYTNVSVIESGTGSPGIIGGGTVSLSIVNDKASGTFVGLSFSGNDNNFFHGDTFNGWVHGFLGSNINGTMIELTNCLVTSNGGIGDPNDAPSVLYGAIFDGSLTNCDAAVITDEDPPVITLNSPAQNPQEIGIGGPYVELGAVAFDNIDGDLTDFIAIDTSALDINTPGSYPVTYSVLDGPENFAQVTRTVTVTTAPTIACNNNADCGGTVPIGGTYCKPNTRAIFQGYQVNVCNDAGQPSASCTWTWSESITTLCPTACAGGVCTTTPPPSDTTPPTITLNGPSTMTIPLGGTFNDPGATATDDTDPSPTINTNGSVNPNVAGTYTRTYTATDDAGNQSAPVSRTVTVTDSGGGGSGGGACTPACGLNEICSSGTCIPDPDEGGFCSAEPPEDPEFMTGFTIHSLEEQNACTIPLGEDETTGSLHMAIFDPGSNGAGGGQTNPLALPMLILKPNPSNQAITGFDKPPVTPNVKNPVAIPMDLPNGYIPTPSGGFKIKLATPVSTNSNPASGVRQEVTEDPSGANGSSSVTINSVVEFAPGPPSSNASIPLGPVYVTIFNIETNNTYIWQYDLAITQDSNSPYHITSAIPAPTSPGTLIVKKILINDDGGTKANEDFEFSISAENDDNELTGDYPFESDGENEYPNAKPDTYTIYETPVAGYETTYSNCEEVVLRSGETQTCTITNDDIADIFDDDDSGGGGGGTGTTDLRIKCLDKNPNPYCLNNIVTRGNYLIILRMINEKGQNRTGLLFTEDQFDIPKSLPLENGAEFTGLTIIPIK